MGKPKHTFVARKPLIQMALSETYSDKVNRIRAIDVFKWQPPKKPGFLRGRIRQGRATFVGRALPRMPNGDCFSTKNVNGREKRK